MKILVVISLALVLLASAKGRKQASRGGAGRRHHGAQQHHEHGVHPKGKESVKKSKHGHHGSHKVHRKMFKKFAMVTSPSALLEDTSALQGQIEQPVQQVMVPVSSPYQSGAPREIVSSYSSTPTEPSQLGTEVAGDQTAQAAPNQEEQPATMQYQGGQQGTAQDTTGVVKTQENAGVTQAELTTGETTETVDPNAGSNNAQGFMQVGDAGKGDALQGYSGALQAGSEQTKPPLEGVAQQEEIKVVNLGDDEKTANAEDRPCGGCPMNAKCVIGQCQIKEEDAKSQGLTGGKGTANNPGTMSDIHNLETQELKTLLKDASSADSTPPGAITEALSGSPETPGTTGTPRPTGTSGPAVIQGPVGTQGPVGNQGPAGTQGPMGNQGPTGAEGPTGAQGEGVAQAELQGQQQEALAATQQHADQLTPTSEEATQHPQMEPSFSSSQVKELRDFARMYKMYQFIRKMEERINDPDCAPICRKVCKDFCPAKCCRRRRHHNATLKASLTQTVAKVQGTGTVDNVKGTGIVTSSPETGTQSSSKPPKLDAKLMEDDDDTKPKEEDEMDEKAGRKHLFVKIVKNNELDKPRRYIRIHSRKSQ